MVGAEIAGVSRLRSPGRGARAEGRCPHVCGDDRGMPVDGGRSRGSDKKTLFLSKDFNLQITHQASVSLSASAGLSTARRRD